MNKLEVIELLELLGHIIVTQKVTVLSFSSEGGGGRVPVQLVIDFGKKNYGRDHKIFEE